MASLRLFDNLRFYVLTGALALGMFAAGWLRLHIVSEQLFYIRLAQVWGLLALVYWYAALVVGPLAKAVGEWGPIPALLFARRAVGVSAALFALGHAAVALWGQNGGLAGIALLPARFRWSLLFGAVALLILLAMAATSFDKAVRFMTFRRWKWLQRCVYAAGILAILHVWLTGTYIAYVDTQLAAAAALIVLFGLEAWRSANSLAAKYAELQHRDLLLTLFVCIWLFWSGLLLVLPKLVVSYHAQHVQHAAQHGGIHD